MRAPPLSGDLALVRALFSGILLALSFPRYGHPAFAWLALAPLMTALFDREHTGRGHRRFLMGFVTGAAYFGGTVYWTGDVVRQFGGLSWPVAVVVASLLVAYLALFPGLFALGLGRLGDAFGARALLLAPAVWVTTELGRTYFWSGFPWVLLGYSQATVLSVAQLASVVGVFGLSALVALVSAVVAFAFVSRSRADLTVGAAYDRTSRASVVAIAVVGAAVIGVVLWGNYRLLHDDLVHEGQAVRVAVVQGNIPQEEKWDPAQAPNILNIYLAMTRRAAGDGARLVIWPESSTPFSFEEEPAGAERIRSVVRETGIELLFGTDQVKHTKPPQYFNAAFMIRRDGSTAGIYQKMHLVPFGEFVPLKDLLFFVAPLVELGEFTPGQSMVMLPTNYGNISTAICYEIVYPGLVRRSVLNGSRLLTTITNDAWYGRSSAPFQHFLQASLRAVEQGRYLVRSANTGISGIVDPYGRVVQGSEIFERTVLIGDVRLIDRPTIYGRIGDAFAYACALLTFTALLFALALARRPGVRRL